MSVENKKIIDFASIDKDGNTILTISDHLEWDSNNKHLLLLQEKINSYLESIESGDLFEKYPHARGRNIIISVVSLYKPTEDGYIFLQRVKEKLKNAGYDFQFLLKNV